MYLALKEMKKEKARFIMIILVVALIAYLVYFLSSLAFGLAQLNRTAIDYWDASGVIVSKSSNENVYASSIDLYVVNELGLQSDDAINVMSTTIYINDGKTKGETPVDLVFIGYDTTNKSIPSPLVEGRDVASNHEVTLSSNLKEATSIGLNDTITVAKTGREFTVVGFTKDSNYNTVPVGYVEQSMASQEMMQYTTGNNGVDALASPTPKMPTRVSAVIVFDDISSIELDGTDLTYIPIDEFINTLPGYQAQVLTFGLMIVALSLISSIIIGIFMYILTMQKKPIFGVLKIQGYRNFYIMRSVIYQSVLLVAIGFGIGLTLTILTINVLPPKVPVAMFWPLYIGVTLFALACSLLGTLFSARSILKIDPLDAL